MLGVSVSTWKSIMYQMQENRSAMCKKGSLIWSTQSTLYYWCDSSNTGIHVPLAKVQKVLEEKTNNMH
jgi:hypothetical protein